MQTDTTPERIELAALRLFLQHGVKKTNLTDVAHQAGVTRVTVYRHYLGRHELVQAVCLRIAAIYQQAADDGPGDSVQEVEARLKQLGERLSALPQGNLLGVLDEIKRLHPDVYEKFSATRRVAVDKIFRNALAVAAREGTLREGLNREVLRALFWAAVVGLIENPTLISSNVSLADIFGTVTELFRHGLLKNAEGKRHA